MTEIVSQCVLCLWFKGKSNTCSAFTEGIPRDILFNEVSHKQSLPGDNDHHWEPRAGFDNSDFPIGAPEEPSDGR